ncbi:NmrA family NAD(P)-binding protein [Methylobacterium sp. J-076]|uniref:NmrA family NAD(P)-binding protein n=1 Tax=Methylobacterium sp. J-076 TaxID=2836655 RepID=UPI001FB97D0B|nr:NAD(P)H-binding protein [Methylobacterium sp. J-076]MCJ2012689.1 NAD(P)H-binding protein [Methylobacterium sp. J-076]
MFVVTGSTGQVGGVVARTLLEAGLPVRVVVRDVDKGAAWKARGCAVAVVPDAADAEALAAAFAGAAGVFLMNPPNYDPAPDFPESRRAAAATAWAVGEALPGRVVLLSTVGAQATAFNLLNWAGFFETALAGTGLPIALLRAAWFMENAAWDLPAAREGHIASYLQPVDRAIEMVSTHDVGRTAADLLREDWAGPRIIELAGPRKYSPSDEAAGLSAALGRPVEAVAVPRETWEARFRAEGMRHPEARIAMLDGFNEGWIDFARESAEHRTGTVAFETVLRHIVEDG